MMCLGINSKECMNSNPNHSIYSLINWFTQGKWSQFLIYLSNGFVYLQILAILINRVWCRPLTLTIDLQRRIGNLWLLLITESGGAEFSSAGQTVFDVPAVSLPLLYEDDNLILTLSDSVHISLSNPNSTVIYDDNSIIVDGNVGAEIKLPDTRYRRPKISMLQ